MQEASTEKLMQDLRAVVEDAEALLVATAGQAGEQIKQARTRAGESLRAAKERLESMKDDVTAQVRESARAADSYVHENPWTAIGVAAGVAFLLGCLVSRR